MCTYVHADTHQHLYTHATSTRTLSAHTNTSDRQTDRQTDRQIMIPYSWGGLVPIEYLSGQCVRSDFDYAQARGLESAPGVLNARTHAHVGF